MNHNDECNICDLTGEIVYYAGHYMCAHCVEQLYKKLNEERSQRTARKNRTKGDQ